MPDADWLKLVPREIPEEQVAEAVRLRDKERGPYVPHHHHTHYEESKH